jgi:hypothetical protein
MEVWKKPGAAMVLPWKVIIEPTIQQAEMMGHKLGDFRITRSNVFGPTGITKRAICERCRAACYIAWVVDRQSFLVVGPEVLQEDCIGQPMRRAKCKCCGFPFLLHGSLAKFRGKRSDLMEVWKKLADKVLSPPAEWR